MKTNKVWPWTVAVLTLVGAWGGCQSTPDLPPIEVDHSKAGSKEQRRSGALAIDEAGIRAVFEDGRAVVTMPVRTISGIGKRVTLRVSLTSLGSEEGPAGESSFVLTGGTREVEVVLPEAALPVTQPEQVLSLIRYDGQVEGEDARVFGRRSLYHALPKIGLRLWAPSRLDTGQSTWARVWVRDLHTGDLLPDVPVTLNGQSATTDVGGQAAFEVAAVNEDTALELVVTAATQGVEVSATRSVEVVPAGAPILFVSTDKPLYRPGQTIHIRALALAQSDRTPVGDAVVVFEVMDGKDNKIFKEELLTDAFGVASLTAPLASQVNVGDYRVRALMNDVTAERSVEVSEEKLPKFAVTTTFDQPYFSPGSAITGVLQARYFFGKAVAGAQVAIVANGSGGARTVSVSGVTDAEGLFAFELTGGSQSSLPLAITVTDTAGFSVEKDVTASVFEPALQVTLQSESASLPSTGPWRVFVTTRGPGGGAVSATCQHTGLDTTAFETDAHGVAAIEVSQSSVNISCSTPEGLTGNKALSLHVDSAYGALLVRTDRAIYQPGEPIEVSVRGNEGIEMAYVDRVHRGRIIESLPVMLSEGQGTVSMTPDATETGLLVLTAYTVTDEDRVINAERLVYVQKPFAQVTLSTDAPTYLPGGEAKLTFQVTDEVGQGAAAAIGITIADEAVFALAGAVGPSEVKAHFLLDDAPTGIRSYALSENPSEVQIAAQVGLAGASNPDPATQEGMTKQALESEANKLLRPELKAIAYALRDDLNAAAETGQLKASNALTQVGGIQLHDFWGQRIQLDVELDEYSWSSDLRVQFRSLGPDELADTWDDYERTLWVYLPGVGRGERERNASSPPMSADAAGGPDPSGTGGSSAGDFEPTDESEAPSNEPRTDFPETLYVNPALITDSSGKAEVVLPMADVITEWRVSMIANTSGGRVGGGQDGITVFQDFFVDTDLPRKLTQNDELQLPIGVFNFSDVPQTVTVNVKSAPWFSLQGAAQQTVTVPAGQSLAVPFGVQVLEAGHHSLEIHASTPTFSDGVVRTVQVLPDGQRINTAASGPLEGSVAQSVSFPLDAISGGNDAWIKLMGGPGAQMVDGVEALLNAPRGCFEPMMNSTWINALVLDYLHWTGTENPSLTTLARTNLDDGVQQCVTFECTEGGFTWFGDPDPAHPILTAFALIMLEDIAGIRDVDQALVGRAQGMLVNGQDMFGGWHSEQGTKNEALPWDELRSTCVVAWGLAASGYEGGDTLAKGIQYIQGAMDMTADTYTMAMCANALLAIDPQDTDLDAVLAELMERAVTEGNLTYWESDYPGITSASGEVIAVETTALVAQALYKLETPPVSVEGALRYLAGKKSPDGNFLSTQGTIQAMRAFVAAAKFAASDTDVEVTVRVGETPIFSTQINESNREVVHLVSLAGQLGNSEVPVTIETTGEGKLYYQVSSAHYVPWTAETRPQGPLMDVHVSYSTLNLTVGESTIATVTVTSSGPADSGDMPMVDFGIPPGFDVDLTALDALIQSDGNIARYEQKADRVVVYLQSLPKQAGTAFEVAVPMSPRYPMTVTTPAARAWAFYKPEEMSESLPVVLTVN